MKSSTDKEKISEIFDWVLINIIIVISIPVAKLILLIVAEETIDMVSLMSDYSLIAFSIAFNVGAYITDKAQKVSYVSTEDLAKDVAEELVRKNSVASAREIAKDFVEKLCVVLTDETKKHFEEAFVNAEKMENKIKAYNKGTYLFAAICLIFFGGFAIIEVKDTIYLLIPFFVLSGLLAACICIWVSLNKNSKAHPASVANESPIPKIVSGPKCGDIETDQAETAKEGNPQDETLKD